MKSYLHQSFLESSEKGPFDMAQDASKTTPNPKGKRELDLSAERKSILKPSTISAISPTESTIPGTLGMALSSHNPARLTSITIRPTSFEPLVHQRVMPQDGAVSPLRTDEYHFNRQQRLHLPTLQTSASGCGRTPPVNEIRIPTPHLNEDSSNNSVIGDIASSEAIHYKNLYFCSQRYLHGSQEQVALLLEENRILKRHLIEFQKRLFSVSRNKRSAMPGSAWEIPASSKRRKKLEDPIVLLAQQRRLSTISETSTLPGESYMESKALPGLTKSVSNDAAQSMTP